MSNNWPESKLCDVLRRSEETIELQPQAEYREITVRLWGKGVVLRGIVTGADVAASRRMVARRGQFILSRIDSRNGALGIVPDELDGAIVSNDFPVFNLVNDRLLPVYLGWMCKTAAFVEKCQRASEGTTNRVRLQEDKFLAMEIPLPPLAEQQGIVARVEELAAAIREARNLRKQATEEADALFDAALKGACDGALTENWRRSNPTIESARELLSRVKEMTWPGHVASRDRRPMNLPPPPSVPPTWVIAEAGDLQERGAILDIQDGNHGSDYPRKAEFGDEGVPFVTAKQIDHGTVCISEAPKLPKERADQLRIGFAMAGDVLLTHNASVGDVAIAPTNAGNFLIGTSVTYWRCNPVALEPRYLFYFMQSEYFQGQLEFIMKQTTRNQVSVLKQVNLWICLPPLLEQRRIVAYLDELRKNTHSLKALQADSSAELDALMPSILDKAFRGEL